jgi:hypothetical protein
MRYTVSLCRDTSGWFATLEAVPREIIHASVTIEGPTRLIAAFDSARDVAQRLERLEGLARVARGPGELR